MNPVLTASLSVGTHSGMIIHTEKWLLHNSFLNVCVFIFIESKAVESGEGETQSSSYLMLTSAAGLNIIRHLQENSLCQLSLQYLFEVCVASVVIIDFNQWQWLPQGNNRSKRSRNFWISLKVVPYVLSASCEGIFPGIELVVTAFKSTGP